MSSFYFHLIHVSYLYVYDTPFLISCNSKGCEDLLLLCLHYLCLIFFHMVICHTDEAYCERPEMRTLLFWLMSIAFRLLFDPVHRIMISPRISLLYPDQNNLPLSSSEDSSKIPRLIEIQIGEGQYISLPVNLPVFLIVSMNTVIVCQQYI